MIKPKISNNLTTNMENQNPATPEKGKRLTKQQAATILIIAIIAWLVSVLFLESTLINTLSTLVAIFAIISLFTKKGLRWK